MRVNEADRLQSDPVQKPRIIPCLDTDGAELLVGGRPVRLFVTDRSIRLDPTVTLDLRRTLGFADVIVKGASY